MPSTISCWCSAMSCFQSSRLNCLRASFQSSPARSTLDACRILCSGMLAPCCTVTANSSGLHPCPVRRPRAEARISRVWSADRRDNGAERARPETRLALGVKENIIALGVGGRHAAHDHRQNRLVVEGDIAGVLTAIVLSKMIDV